MKFKILVKVSREKPGFKSSAEGEITEDNFAEMVEELNRWLEAGGKAEILGIEEL